MSAEIKPKFLLVEELNYELRIRGVQTSRDVNDKRKMLSKLLDKERHRKLVIADPNFIFDTERLAIDTTLENIKQIIREFEGPSTDSTYVRLRARLAHVSARVQRMALTPEHGAEAATFKNEAYASCLLLEAELDERVTPGGASAVTQGTPAVGQAALGEAAAGVTHVHYSRPAEIYKWDTKFNGTMDGFAAKNFLERVGELAQARHVSKAQLFEAASDLFVGKGRLWLQQVKAEASVTDWDSLAARLEKDFVSATYEEDLWHVIKTRGQRKEESVVIFLAVMQSLFNRLKSTPSESTRVKWILKNLKVEIRDKLLLQDFGSVAELSVAAHKIEEALGEFSRASSDTALVGDRISASESRRNANRRSGLAAHHVSSGHDVGSLRQSGAGQVAHAGDQRNSGRGGQARSMGFRGPRRDMTRTTGTPETSVGRKNCWNCGLPNHGYRSCKLKLKRFCFKCGKPNATVLDCDRCSGNA